MLVRDCMNTNPIMIHGQDDYKNAVKIMEKNTLHHLPVLDDRERLVGIVSDHDLLLAATRYLLCDVEVAEVMHRGVVTATPRMPLDEAASLMAAHHVGGLPVLGDDGTVVGIITKSDILKTVAQHMH
jgi:acetoin utilization protein AcuB